MTGAKTYEVEPVRSDTQMRYFRWIDDNIKAIDKATGGRVGYMHINAMGGGGIGEFDKYWRAFRYKEGVIIDVRRNSGGWTEYFLIDKLERELVAFNNLRDMVPFRYPGSAGNGNYVVISNENNGSDGEAFVEHFKARKLGPVVGRPVLGRPGRHPQRAADDRQRHGRAVEQRLLRPGREVAGREPRRRPRYPGRQRPRLGHGRPRPPAREGHRGHAREDQGQPVEVRPETGLSEEIGPEEGLSSDGDCPSERY